jgi:hypothetical protein
LVSLGISPALGCVFAGSIVFQTPSPGLEAEKSLFYLHQFAFLRTDALTQPPATGKLQPRNRYRHEAVPDEEFVL